MGEQQVEPLRTDAERRRCTEAVLRDLDALEQLLLDVQIDEDQMHCGLEQEMFLVQPSGRPAPIGPELLATLTDRRLVSELARFNLEANLDPHPLDANFLSRLESDLREVLATADQGARALGARVLLVGSLPSLEVADLSSENMSPEPRYKALNDALLEERGSAIRLSVHGWDRYEGTHDNVMPEAANTSLQLHRQVKVDEFATVYNWTQLLSAPLLAAATNSPFFCGRRLWHESRVAVFENATDGRTSDERARGLEPRVGMGQDWLRGGVIELFRRQVARYRPLLWRHDLEDPFEALEAGRVPKLEALMLHNGTLWKWNRACYGSGGKKPHLRIETRVLPAGPTILDEMAHVAFFFGLLAELPVSDQSAMERLSFGHVRQNFSNAARNGLDARLRWVNDDGGRGIPADQLILEQLVPAADAGLQRYGVSEPERTRLLDVLRERVSSKQTASVWLMRSAQSLEGHGRDVLPEVTRQMQRHQDDGEPVHRWPVATAPAASPIDPGRRAKETGDLAVRDIMVRDVFTVRSGEAYSLASSLMRWQHIRHVPVVDKTGEVVGLMTARTLLAAAQMRRTGQEDPLAVNDVMEEPPTEVSPDTDLAGALDLLLVSRGSCLIVRRPNGPLLGIVTEHDFLRPLRALLN
jgi:CBS domain-containing protein/gamma-glutamyl:cysteine ligase YbdK (ATP-grasp superfamily)